MEHIVAKLLQDFENGKVSRRQLIKNLVLTATAASAVGATPLAVGAASLSGDTPSEVAPENKLIKAVSIHHISIQCKDYSKERDFYSSLLGLPVSNDDGKSCQVKVGETILLFRNPGKRREAIAGPDGKVQHGSDALGVDHIAYRLDNWETDKNVEEAMRAELARRGLPTGMDVDEKAGTSSFHVSDLDGLGVQIGGKREIPPTKPGFSPA